MLNQDELEEILEELRIDSRTETRPKGQRPSNEITTGGKKKCYQTVDMMNTTTTPEEQPETRQPTNGKLQAGIHAPGL